MPSSNRVVLHLLVKKLPEFNKTLKFVTVLKRTRHCASPEPCKSCPHPPTPFLWSQFFFIILLSMSRSRHSVFPHQKSVCISLLPLRIACPEFPSSLIWWTEQWRRVQIMKFLSMPFSSVFSYLLSLCNGVQYILITYDVEAEVYRTGRTER